MSLFKIMAKQLFDLQHLHADPNPANFAFRKNGQIILYDFGCTKLLNAPLVEAYRKTILAGLNEDYPAVEEGLIRCGARNLDGPAVEHEYYKMWRDIFARPFVDNCLYDFSKSDLHTDALKHLPLFFAHHVRSFSPPAELAFVDRVIVGHYGILRKLGSKAHFLELLEPHLLPQHGKA